MAVFVFMVWIILIFSVVLVLLYILVFGDGNTMHLDIVVWLLVVYLSWCLAPESMCKTLKFQYIFYLWFWIDSIILILTVSSASLKLNLLTVIIQAHSERKHPLSDSGKGKLRMRNSTKLRTAEVRKRKLTRK